MGSTDYRPLFCTSHGTEDHIEGRLWSDISSSGIVPHSLPLFLLILAFPVASGKVSARSGDFEKRSLRLTQLSSLVHSYLGQMLAGVLNCSLPNQGDFQICGLQFQENLRAYWLRVLEIEISTSGGFLINERPMPGSHPVSPSMGQEIFQKGIMVSDDVLKSVLQLPENLKNKFLVFYLILSLYLPYIPATRSHVLEAMLKDLEKIKVSSEIDAYLYTADLNYPSHCNQSVMKCFQLEMEVVSYESKFGDRKFYDRVNSIVRLVEYLLSIQTNTDTQACQRCETYKEKKYSDFITDFMFVIQRINQEETKMKIGH